MTSNEPPPHWVGKSVDCFRSSWGHAEEAQRLGHMGPRDAKLAGEVSPGRQLSGDD